MAWHSRRGRRPGERHQHARGAEGLHVGGAYASFEEQWKGTLEPGMLADMQIYKADPLGEDNVNWEQLRPRAVLLGGVKVFGSF